MYKTYTGVYRYLLLLGIYLTILLNSDYEVKVLTLSFNLRAFTSVSDEGLLLH